jgi:ABC-2 type transport system ATP-binding protein
LTELKQCGTTILLSTHIVPDVEALADKVAILKRGLLHSIHDMSAATRAAHFEVVLSRMPHGAIADVIRGCRCVPAGPKHPGAIVHVPDLERLQRLLAWCSDLGTEVQAVNTPRTSLEEVFLKALNEDSNQEASEPC